mmetsp:Transcript_15043/g.31403  ORF Transcript_15043/g.31403 Transcript_15043/m.31403 type:complete len:260 (+) Transcript_15043:82-861(+)
MSVTITPAAAGARPGGMPAVVMAQLPHPQMQPISTARSTAALLDPASVAAQKEEYRQSLDDQLERGQQSLKDQNAERKRQLHEAAEQRKAALILEVEKQVKLQEMVLDEQLHQAMLGLKQAALDQRAALESQAAALTLEYQQRKMHEEFAESQAELQRQYMESHTELQTQAHKLSADEQSRGQPAGNPAGLVQIMAPRQMQYVPMQYMTNGGAAPAASYASPPGYGNPTSYSVSSASYVLPHAAVPIAAPTAYRAVSQQ